MYTVSFCSKTEYANGEYLVSTIRVLQVDDDSAFLNLSREILLDMDGTFRIDFALTVNEAETKLATQDYDVVVADYDLPQKNGLDFLRKLREQGNKLPFILFTGKGKEEVAKQALNIGANGYLNKQGSIEAVYGQLASDINLLAQKRRAELCLTEYEKRYRPIFSNENETARIKALFELLTREVEVIKMMANDLPFSKNDSELLNGLIGDSIERLHSMENEIIRLKTFFAKDGLK